jgi:hypothetical protein
VSEKLGCIGEWSKKEMEIPDVLRNLSVDDEPKLAFIATLLHDEPCGIIVKDTAFIDDVLLKDVLLAYHRVAGAAAGYTEAQVSKMTFDKKITTLAGLALSPDARPVRDLAVSKMTPMRKIRNKTAHKASLTSSEAEELWGDADNRQLLADFPDNFKAECAAVQRALQDLLNHANFGGK